LYTAGADAVVLVPLIEDDPVGQIATLAHDLMPLLQRGNG
jgi:hypothetical protein